MNFKSVKKVIFIGQIWINLPVFIIMIGFPFLIWFSLGFTENPILKTTLTIISCPIGFALAWFWWSLNISKWRTWAFKSVKEDDWINLKQSAIRSNLIWEDGSKYEKTEIRTKSEKKFIKNANEKIHELSQIEEIKIDLATPKRVAFQVDSSKFNLNLFANSIILLIAIIAFFTNVWYYGIILIVIFLYLLFKVTKSKHFNYKGDALIISNDGIHIKIFNQNYLWEEIEIVNVDRHTNSLIIYLDEKNQKDGIEYDLSYLNLEDTDTLMNLVNVFSQRYTRKMEEGEL